jgi:hypothetical protein
MQKALSEIRALSAESTPEYLAAAATLAAGILIAEAIVGADTTTVLDEIRSTLGNLDVELENITGALRSK